MSAAILPADLDKGAVMRAILAGFCASLVSIGLARFAYTPLIPPLIDAHWFAAKDVIYLGAANLIGYLAGALLGRPLAHRLTARQTLRGMMVVASLAFFACAFPLSVSWFFVWRFLSGLAGGVIMVLVASTILPHVPFARRGGASGAIFLGIGLGIAAAGTLVPLLLSVGLRETWLGLGAVSLILTAISWSFWPRTEAKAVPQHVFHHAARVGTTLELNVLYFQYALMAIGLVPMMLFLVDYVARGLGMGTHTAALFWILYGVGATAGPVVYGWLADRIGPVRTSSLALWLQAAAVGAMISSNNMIVMVLATLLIGSFPPGIVPITLGRVHKILHGDVAAQTAAWSRATTIYALFQALAGYGYSFLFARSGGDYRLLMGIGGAALLLALISGGVKKVLASR